MKQSIQFHFLVSTIRVVVIVHVLQVVFLVDHHPRRHLQFADATAAFVVPSPKYGHINSSNRQQQQQRHQQQHQNPHIQTMRRFQNGSMSQKRLPHLNYEPSQKSGMEDTMTTVAAMMQDVKQAFGALSTKRTTAAVSQQHPKQHGPSSVHSNDNATDNNTDNVTTNAADNAIDNNTDNNADNATDNVTNNAADNAANDVIIGPNSTLNLEENNGALEFANSLLVQGTFIGNIMSKTTMQTRTPAAAAATTPTVHIEKQGQLRTNIMDGVMNVLVHGKLVGNVHCDKLHLGKDAVLIGDIKTRSLRVEEGATIIGSISCGEDVLSEITEMDSDNDKSSKESTVVVYRIKNNVFHGTYSSTSNNSNNSSNSDIDTIISGSGSNLSYNIECGENGDITVTSSYMHDVDGDGNVHELNGGANEDDDKNDDEDIIGASYLNESRDINRSSDVNEFDGESGISGEIIEGSNEESHDYDFIENNNEKSHDYDFNGESIEESHDYDFNEKNNEESDFNGISGESNEESHDYDFSGEIHEESNEGNNEESDLKGISGESNVESHDYDFSREIREESNEGNNEESDLKGISGESHVGVLSTSIDEGSIHDENELYGHYDIMESIHDETNGASSGFDDHNDINLEISDNMENEKLEFDIISGHDNSYHNEEINEFNIEHVETIATTMMETEDINDIYINNNESTNDEITDFFQNQKMVTEGGNDISIHGEDENLIACPSNGQLNDTDLLSDESNAAIETIVKEEKMQWKSRHIGNFMDRSNNVIVPIANGHTSKNGVVNIQIKNTFDRNGASSKKAESKSIADMYDDFGNPLYPHLQSKKKSLKTSNTYKNNKDGYGQYHDEFGNPLLRGAHDNEVAGYRQIREISAVTREILDAHIQEKKKEAIEKAARATPQARIERHLIEQYALENEGEEDGHDVPSFLR